MICSQKSIMPSEWPATGGARYLCGSTAARPFRSVLPMIARREVARRSYTLAAPPTKGCFAAWLAHGMHRICWFERHGSCTPKSVAGIAALDFRHA
jgi:hypothetical protein